MIVIIDANIALALLINLPYSANARQAVNSATKMIAPELIMHEAANALWKMAKANHEIATQATSTITQIPHLLDELASTTHLAQQACAMAIHLNHPAYDCFYIALALQMNATLISADKRLITMLQKSDMRDDVKYLAV